jgi:hypothetical protein
LRRKRDTAVDGRTNHQALVVLGSDVDDDIVFAGQTRLINHGAAASDLRRRLPDRATSKVGPGAADSRPV